MKQFRYQLETVLRYKNQVLDDKRGQYAAALRRTEKKKAELDRMNGSMKSLCRGMDEKVMSGSRIEELRLYDMCISHLSDVIRQEKEALACLEKEQEKKKNEVVHANVDASRYEKLKDRRFGEYRREELKAQEQFIEEFVSYKSGSQKAV